MTRFVLAIGVAMVAFGPFGAGCARPRTEVRRLPAWVFESSRADGRLRKAPRSPPRPRWGVRGRSEASDFVVAALQGAGLRFGTDGSVPALWEYLRSSQVMVNPTAARSGDVLFFQTETAPPPPDQQPAAACESPDHVAIAVAVDDDGRVAFVEARTGKVMRGHLDPNRPRARRDGMGRVLNSFLRPKRPGDAETTPTFAGEMLCGVARPRP